MKRKTLWFAGVVLLSLSGWALRKTLLRSKAPLYQSVRPERGDLQLTILTTGIIQPENRVEVKPPIAGRVEEIVIREGARVTKGTILAWLSSTERAALLDAARARGAEELAHWEEFYKPTPLIAPLNGEIIARSFEAGQTFSSNDTVYVLSDHLIVKADVDETDIGRIRRNQRVRFNLDSYPAVTINGTVSKIAFESRTINSVTTYQVYVIPETVPPFMKSGMTANVWFLGESRKMALLIPTEAVRTEGNQTVVWIPDPIKPDKPLSRRIRIGLSDGKKTEVLDGLVETDTLLMTALPSAEEKSKINPFGFAPPKKKAK